MAKLSAVLLTVMAVCAVIALVMAVISSFIPSWIAADETERASSSSVAIPEEYRDVVLRAGSVCSEITPSIIAAQVQQESSWNASTSSGVGAQGISQFMPATWAAVGMDGDGDGVADVWNAVDAIWSEGNHLCSLVSEVKTYIDAGSLSGDVVSLALAAYNAGMGAVVSYGGIPPYQETKDYVAAILASASTDEGGVSSTLVDAVEWARTVAADDTYAYVWAGEGRQDGGYDCSGLTQAVYARLGVSLSHNAAAQQQSGTAVSREDLKVGDLIFWGAPAYHVAVYAGDGMMVSADNELSGINYEAIYGSPSGYRRVL